MGLFGGEQERARKQNLRALEDKRLAFAQRLAQAGVHLERALLVQTGGGFRGVALGDGKAYLLSGPAPGEDGDFEIGEMGGLRAWFEPHIVPSEGGGGLLGFGKKGGSGYMLKLRMGEGEPDQIRFVPALEGVLEVREGEPMALLSEKRRRGDANFVWDFLIIKPSEMDAIAKRWQRLLGN